MSGIAKLNDNRAPDSHKISTDLIPNTEPVRIWIAKLLRDITSNHTTLGGDVRVSIATAISKVKGEAPTALNSRLVVSGPWLLRILSNIALQRLQREIGDSRRPRLHATRPAPRVATAEPVALQDLFPVTDSQSKGVSVQQGGFKTGRSASQLACSVFELLKTLTAMGLTTYVCLINDVLTNDNS